MQMNVDEEKKLVMIWLSNAEKNDPVIRENLKPLYAEYKKKKYWVAVFESGEKELYQGTLDLLAYNKRRCAELAQNPYFKGTPIPEKGLRYMNVISGTMTNDRHLGTLDFAFYTDRDPDRIKAELAVLFERIRAAIATLN